MNTKNLNLFKPDLNSVADITAMNQNWDIIDEEVAKAAKVPVTSEVPADADIWIDPNDNTVEESHLTNTNNPHNVTAEQIFGAGMTILSSHQYGTTLPSVPTKGRLFFKKVNS